MLLTFIMLHRFPVVEQMTRICKHCFRAKITIMKITHTTVKGINFFGVMIKEKSSVHHDKRCAV